MLLEEKVSQDQINILNKSTIQTKKNSNKKAGLACATPAFYGGPDRARTCDLQIRSLSNSNSLSFENDWNQLLSCLWFSSQQQEELAEKFRLISLVVASACSANAPQIILESQKTINEEEVDDEDLT